ncbi:MAG TPA: hypothetical protein VF683_08090 [Chthoniobacterales bacterium]
MRTTLASGILLLSIVAAHAQEQEQKLLDRLLRPEASVQNPNETKQFVSGGDVLNKRVPTKPFFVPRSWWNKKFSGVKEVRTKAFSTHESILADKQANTTPRNKLTKIDAVYPTTAYVTRDSADNGRTAPTRDYPGVRPFLGRGKNQKALSAKDRPLTIDEVRELLNKSK